MLCSSLEDQEEAPLPLTWCHVLCSRVRGWSLDAACSSCSTWSTLVGSEMAGPGPADRLACTVRTYCKLWPSTYL